MCSGHSEEWVAGDARIFAVAAVFFANNDNFAAECIVAFQQGRFAAVAGAVQVVQVNGLISGALAKMGPGVSLGGAAVA